MWYRKQFLILAPPNILFIDNKKSFAKINLQRIYIFIIRQYFSISCLDKIFFDLPSSSIIYTLFVGMAYTLQARSRYIDVQNYPLLMEIWEYPFRHALATFLA